jgi:hypothetical protein
MSRQRYTATYTFNGYLRGEYGKPIARISETAAEMRREGVDVEFLGATQEINAAGQLIAVTARYVAPSKGTIGRLNCRACLPASGSPRADRPADSEPADQPSASARR